MTLQTTPANIQESKEATGDGLEFPIASGFHSQPPRIDLQVMLRRIEEHIPWRSSRPGERERRAGQVVIKEFVL